MFCKNCGAETKPNAKFCDVCGARLEEQVQDAQNTQETTPVQETVVEAQPVQEANPVPEAVSAVAKRSKSSLFATIGIAVVAVAVVVGAFPYIKNAVTKLFTSPEGYYRAVEQNAIEDGVSTVTELVDDYKNTAEDALSGGSYLDYCFSALDNKKVESKFNINIGNSIIKAASDSLGYDLSSFKNIGFGYDVALKDDVAGMDLSLSLGGKNIVAANVVLNIDDGEVYVELPKLADKAIKIDIEELAGVDFDEMLSSAEADEAMQMLSAVVEAVPDSKTLDKILGRYIDVVLEEIDDVEQEKDEISVGDIDAKCTALQVTVKGKTLEKILKALLKEAKDDDDLWDIAEDFMEAVEPGSADLIDEARDSLDDNYDEMIDELDGAFEGFDKLEYTTYVNSKGEIIGRDIEYADMKIALYALEKGNNRAFEISMQQGGIKYFSVIGEGKESRGTYNGEISLEVAGQDVAVIEVSDFDTKEALKGKFVLKPSKTVSSMLPSLVSDLEDEMGISLKDFGIDVSNVSLAVEYNTTKKKDEIVDASYSIELRSGSNSIIGISVDSVVSDAKKISAPSGAVNVRDEDDLEDWANDIDLSALLDSLPDDIGNILGGLGNESVSVGRADYDVSYGYEEPDVSYGYWE